MIIADDHALVRAGIREVLRHEARIQVVAEACDGAEALELIHYLQPDLLLLDIQMPVIDGIEVIQRLQGSRSPVAILVLSAYMDEHYIQTLLDLGADGYLTKDDAPEMLAQAVRRVAGGERGWIHPLSLADAEATTAVAQPFV